MNFFLNKPFQQTRLSDEQLENLARENMEKAKAQQKMKPCGCCAEEAKSEKPTTSNPQEGHPTPYGTRRPIMVEKRRCR